MSLEATLATWKIAKGVITASEKLFLLSCARRANEDHECWPSIKRMTEDTGFDRKTIISVRQILIEKNLLRYTGEMKGRSEQIPVMQLTYVHDEEVTINSRHKSTVDSQSTSTEIGTGEKFTSTEIGTGTSTEIGTLNSKEENLSIKTYVDSPKSTDALKDYSEDEHFMNFYSVYPNKQKPKVAHDAFYKAARKARMQVPAFSQMVKEDVLVRLKNNWAGRTKNKYPFPQKYLNDAEWQGEINTPNVKANGQANGASDATSYW